MKSLWLFCLIALGQGVHAQEQIQYKDKVADYVVVSGDTIRGITLRTLGSVDFWEANWRLNPTVADPDLLRIGQSLRIITSREVIAERARIELATNNAEKRVQRSDWLRATVGDEVAEGDAIRTRERSTAVLRFSPGSQLRLGEFSQVYLTRKETTLAGIDRGSVEISEGDVEVVFESLNRPAAEIELISGGSTVTTAPDAAGLGQIRAGKVGDGGSRVMVYSGASKVSAAGESVSVATGMGTRVPASGPPAAPEKLLAAPQLDKTDLHWNYSNGILAWTSVAGARSYTLELCGDRACEQLVLRRSAISGTDLQLQPQQPGNYYFRVSALSASGLDGYFSKPGTLEISDAKADLEGPMIVVKPGHGFFVGLDGKSIAGASSSLEVAASDERSGLASLQWRYGDEAFRPLVGNTLKLKAGLLELQAFDALGNEQRLSYRIE